MPYLFDKAANGGHSKRSKNEMIRRILMLVGLLAATPAAWSAETPALLNSAIGAWTTGTKDWAFHRRTRLLADDGSVKEERVEVYDPSLPDATRWTLVSVNGQPPTADQVAKEQKKNAKPRKYGSDSPGKLLELDQASVRKESADAVTYEIPVKSVAGGLVQTNKLLLLITVDRKTQAIERLTASLRGPMKIALGLARITDVDLDLSFDPAPDPAETTPPSGGTAHATLSAFGNMMEYEWTDFHVVQEYQPTPKG